MTSKYTEEFVNQVSLPIFILSSFTFEQEIDEFREVQTLCLYLPDLALAFFSVLLLLQKVAAKYLLTAERCVEGTVFLKQILSWQGDFKNCVIYKQSN